MAGRVIQSTTGAAIKTPPLDRITIYAPDGTPHTCAPVDAREILASGNGYTAEPPVVEAIIAEVFNEQQPKQQPEPDNAAPAVSPETASEAEPVASPRRAGRPRKFSE